ncbi:hypothetical protein LBMAG37_16860 [Anaerolineae bacterium]|nr:hypothetical protein LBMAG37_16860 [Anaerolineae bacterium]
MTRSETGRVVVPGTSRNLRPRPSPALIRIPDILWLSLRSGDDSINEWELTFN